MIWGVPTDVIRQAFRFNIDCEVMQLSQSWNKPRTKTSNAVRRLRFINITNISKTILSHQLHRPRPVIISTTSPINSSGQMDIITTMNTSATDNRSSKSSNDLGPTISSITAQDTIINGNSESQINPKIDSKDVSTRPMIVSGTPKQQELGVDRQRGEQHDNAEQATPDQQEHPYGSPYITAEQAATTSTIIK
ncbi:hypothetical protein BDK51DRAFT_27265 [Blyttiomyces helicus]|uniref:Uncharacterized protein n=1 Tax=Blyttiomyces helicus TaxID=388810 RepID=A0A4P9WKW9_9FUNG|nr:hypothetical protein BDK51DRAFT_27265 [Blyttiomyces helicus]|eukprot:RKO93042.1 hypothetical protein BDK51DRAFT_27265 [Blyttiomyces helicus]